MHSAPSCRPRASRPAPHRHRRVMQADQHVPRGVLLERAIERRQALRASRPSPFAESPNQVSSSTMTQLPSAKLPPIWKGGCDGRR